MNFFFDPKSIAVVGASKRPWGSNLLENILKGYKGKVYPVNPNYEQLEGLTCYPSVKEIPGEIDLAILVIPAPAVTDVLHACGQKRVPGIIIESGGFAEIGDNGKSVQDKCIAIANEYGMRIWGPNCLGLVDIPGKKFFTFTFPRIFDADLLTGKVSMVVQSGALTGAFLPELMNRSSIGLSKVCSLGNKADVDECDVLEYLFEDDQTEAIALYLESIPRGKLFLEMLSQSEKPVVVLKVGESEAGVKAAITHTASLAGDAQLTRSLLESSGCVLADDFQHMVDLARTTVILPRLPQSARIAVLTPSGASSILACDLFERYGLTLASLSKDTLKSLSLILPSWMPPVHPVDLGPAIEIVGSLSAAVEQAITITCRDQCVDVIMVHYFFVDGDLLNLESMKKYADQKGKVLVFWGVGFQDDVMAFRREAHRMDVLVFDELSRATECLAAAVRLKTKELGTTRNFTRRQSQKEPVPHSENDKNAPLEVLDEVESKSILASWEIPVVAERCVSDLSEATEFANEWGYPLVLKGVTAGAIHKSELGLVEKHIYSQTDLQEAFSKLKSKLGDQDRYLIQPKARIDYELIAGFIQDPQFGACVMVGMGGLFAEFLPDVAFALAPLDKKQALNLLQRIKARHLFDGYRGIDPLERESVANILITLSKKGISATAITQIDINPLAVYRGRPVVLDATIISTSKDMNTLHSDKSE